MAPQSQTAGRLKPRHMVSQSQTAGLLKPLHVDSSWATSKDHLETRSRLTNPPPAFLTDPNVPGFAFVVCWSEPNLDWTRRWAIVVVRFSVACRISTLLWRMAVLIIVSGWQAGCLWQLIDCYVRQPSLPRNHLMPSSWKWHSCLARQLAAWRWLPPRYLPGVSRRWTTVTGQWLLPWCIRWIFRWVTRPSTSWCCHWTLATTAPTAGRIWELPRPKLLQLLGMAWFNQQLTVNMQCSIKLEKS